MPKEELKYSKAIEELEKILQRIQNEEIDIDDLAKEAKRATDLIKLCKEKIEKTELEIKGVVKSLEAEKE